MRNRHLWILLPALGLAACGSSTEPGEAAYSLTDSFPPDEAELVQEDADGARLRFDDIDFGASSSATLTSADEATLDRFAQVFANLPGATYVVESHTDNRAASDESLRLSLDRADEVRRYLAKTVRGAGPYIEAVGRGSEEPLESNSTVAGRDRNDRVEVVVEYRQGPVTRVVLRADVLDVELDCDQGSEPGAIQPGEFYVTVSIRVSNSDGFFVMDEVVRRRFAANDGDVLALDVGASAAIRGVEGDILEVFVRLQEYDGNNNWHFTKSETYQYGYNLALGCWGPWGKSSCGTVGSGAISVLDSEVGGSPCQVSMSWSLRVEDI